MSAAPFEYYDAIASPLLPRWLPRPRAAQKGHLAALGASKTARQSRIEIWES